MMMTAINITIANIYDNRNKVGRGEGRLAKCYSRFYFYLAKTLMKIKMI